MKKTYFILGVRVISGPYGLKIFTRNKDLADKIWKYWNEEFAPNFLTDGEDKIRVGI